MTAASIARDLAGEIDRALRAAGTPERAAQEKRYLKSELTHYGCTLPVVRATAKAALKARPALDHDALVAAVNELWGKPVHERRAAAVELLIARPTLLTRADVPLLERLLRESRTWALVDAIAPAVVGPLFEREPAALGKVLDRWAKDDDFWLRRAAMLSLLVPLRKGGGDWDRFARYADAMLAEKEFFIRKAIGWILREVAKQRPELVTAWLAPRAARAAGLTVREAVKYLPAADRRRIEAARG